MYRVLIVEDEMFVRLGLKNLIPWEKYKMEIAADFSNGKSALEFFLKERPEVVITDIRMPVMDGMELIRRIREVSEDTLVILLTCLEDFGLAQEAIRMGAFGYISKLSMKEDEMELLIDQARKRLDAAHVREFDSVKTADKKAIVKNVLKQAVFSNLYGEEELWGYCESLPVRLTEFGLTLCILDMGRMDGIKMKFGDNRDFLIQFSLMNLVEETVGRVCLGEMLTLSDQQYLLFLSFQTERTEEEYERLIGEALDQVQYSLKIYFNTAAFIGMSSCGGRLTDLSGKYAEAVSALESRFLFSSETDRCRYGGLTNTDYFMGQMKALLDGEVFRSLTFDKREEFMERAGRLACQPGEVRNKTAELVFEYLQLITEYVDVGEVRKQKILQNTRRELELCQDMKAVNECCARTWDAVREAGGLRRGPGPEIMKALEIIAAEYGQENSLIAIAERVGLSPAYFSALFKKEMKVNYVEYLNRVRIERAKELLLKTDESVSEVSDRTGFKDNTYFSRVFRRMTGESPGEYRKNRTLEDIR